MPSIEEILEILDPLVDEKVAKAVIAERAHCAREVIRLIDRGSTTEGVRLWCQANLELLEYVEQI